jgi:hypothetical protein
MVDLTNTKNDSEQEPRFAINRNNLYREQAITDYEKANIKKLVPIKADGSPDTSRTTIFYGHAQLLTPVGPYPIQARLAAKNLSEAFDELPNAIEQAIKEALEELHKMNIERTP